MVTAKLVDDAIGEAPKGPLAQIVDKDEPAFWSLRDLHERSLKRGLKACSGLGRILVELVPAACSPGLMGRSGMPAELNHPTR